MAELSVFAAFYWNYVFLCRVAYDAWFYVILTIFLDVNPSVLNVESCVISGCSVAGICGSPRYSWLLCSVDVERISAQSGVLIVHIAFCVLL